MLQGARCFSALPHGIRHCFMGPFLEKSQLDDQPLVLGETEQSAAYNFPLLSAGELLSRVILRLTAQFDLQRHLAVQTAAVMIGRPIMRHPVQVGAYVQDRAASILSGVQKSAERF
jgi:hypothetical protein